MKTVLSIIAMLLLSACAINTPRTEQCSGIRTTIGTVVVQDREDCVWGQMSRSYSDSAVSSLLLGIIAVAAQGDQISRGRSKWGPECPKIYRNGHWQCQ